MWNLFFLYASQSFLTIFAFKIKYYSPLQDKWSMFYILHWQFEWEKMSLTFYHNMSLTFSTVIWHYMAVIFISIGTMSWLSRFFKFASTFPITRLTFCLSEACLQVKYNNVVLHRLQIFRIPFTYQLTLRRIPKISNQMLYFRI